jgi:hypothetical protein
MGKDFCNEEVFNKGEYVGMLAADTSAEIEGVVKKAAQNARQRMDWHYCGGRARVLTLGDVQNARRSLRALVPPTMQSLIPEES